MAHNLGFRISDFGFHSALRTPHSAIVVDKAGNFGPAPRLIQPVRQGDDAVFPFANDAEVHAGQRHCLAGIEVDVRAAEDDSGLRRRLPHDLNGPHHVEEGERHGRDADEVGGFARDVLGEAVVGKLFGLGVYDSDGVR